VSAPRGGRRPVLPDDVAHLEEIDLRAGYHVGIDTGGTFTDVIVMDDAGAVTLAKSPTTPHDLSSGLMSSLTEAAGYLGLDVDEFLASVQVMRFSGTTATNALLTRMGDPTGLITTKGFEDTLFIGRAVSAWAGLSETELRRVYRKRKPEPLIPRRLVRGVSERVDWSGRVLVPLSDDEVRRAATELVDAGVQSLAIGFLWSTRNAAHEESARRIVRELHPNLPLHCSHDVAASAAEYERFATAAVDAYVSPVLTRFLGGFQGTLAAHGFRGQFLIAQADGGCLYPQDARPVFTLQSGPAAGVIASKLEGERLGLANVVTTDVGGTSFDVGLVADGGVIYARDPELGRQRLSVPMIEVASIGAGGGSIAWVDEVGVLHVGPKSAGAMPGPACYGHGGTLPTVSDADLLLGYLDPDHFLGGRMKLSVDAALAAIEPVAERVGLGFTETAAGIFQIANAHMADLLTRQIVSRGYDPRDFTIFAYGGAGPMHCAFYGMDSGAQEVVVPVRAAAFSALGVGTAPVLHNARASAFAQLPCDPAWFNEQLGALDARVTTALDKDRIAEEYREVVYAVEMRFGRQVHTVRLAIPRRQYDEAALEDVSRLFAATYDRLYGAGSGYPEAGTFVTAFVVDGFGHLPVPAIAAAGSVGDSDPGAARTGTREAHFGGAFVPTDVFLYERLRPGHVLEAPAIVESRETTVVIPPGCTATVDAGLNIRIRWSSGRGGTDAISVADAGVA
jgi:N-methylhydantoinase A